MYNNTLEEIYNLNKNHEFDLEKWNDYFINNILVKESIINAWEYINIESWKERYKYVIENYDNRFDKLLGVPIGVKDIFNTIDMPTSMGSLIWKGFMPGNDARVLHNIKFNGGIIAGKTVTAEFAVHTPNKTRNPHDVEMSPGTSSSGSAAAVASGMIPVSLGTQTGGSISRPASYCGVYGFKPSFGTIPRTGMLKTTDTLDTVGLFATNIFDCEYLFNSIRVKGLDYPFVSKKLENNEFQKLNGAKWRVGIIIDQHKVFQNYSLKALNSFEDLISRLNSISNISLFKPKFTSLFNETHNLHKTIYHKSLSYYFKDEFTDYSLISEVMYDIISEGNTISLDSYLKAIDNQVVVSREIDSVFNGLDVLITLTTADTAPKFGTAIDLDDTCLIWTMCGCPTVSVPIFEINNMPIGVQIIGRKYNDFKVINFIKEMVDKELFPRFSKIV